MFISAGYVQTCASATEIVEVTFYKKTERFDGVFWKTFFFNEKTSIFYTSVFLFDQTLIK